MKYFTIVKNPFSFGLQHRLQSLVDDKWLADNFIQLLPIDELKKEINEELEKYDLKIQHILLFYKPPNRPIESHVDFFKDDRGKTVCNSSLVLPWICKDGYTVYWEDGEFDLLVRSPPGHSNIEYHEINWKSDHKVSDEAKIHTPVVVKTNIPHGVYSIDSKLLLATVRFEENPSFEELSKKLSVE
jgi:hypothetical protein